MENDIILDVDEEIISEVEKVITEDSFAQYLLSHCVNFVSASFILQTLLDAVKEVKETLKQ